MSSERQGIRTRKTCMLEGLEPVTSVNIIRELEPKHNEKQPQSVIMVISSYFNTEEEQKLTDE